MSRDPDRGPAVGNELVDALECARIGAVLHIGNPSVHQDVADAHDAILNDFYRNVARSVGASVMMDAQRHVAQRQRKSMLDVLRRRDNVRPDGRLAGPANHGVAPEDPDGPFNRLACLSMGIDGHVLPPSCDEGLVSEPMVAVIMGVDNPHDRPWREAFQLLDRHFTDLHRCTGVNDNDTLLADDEGDV